MATDQVRTKTTRHEAFVASQLARAERRIRRYDVARGLLVLLAGTLVWFGVVAVLHRYVGLASWTRILALGGYSLAAGLTTVWAVVRPWRKPLNPLYAAFQVERLLPSAKNSVASYLDLRDQHLPGTLRQALGLRAARDLADAEPERAISPRPLIHTGVVAGVVAVVFLTTVVAIGLGSLLAVLWPFSSTRVTVVRPEGGDATIPAGRPLTVVVLAENVQEAYRDDVPRLLFHSRPDAPDLERALQAQEDGCHWTITLAADEIRTGLTYRVRAFGIETPTYRITVRPSPVLLGVRATYHYRPYVGRPDFTSNDRDLKALCGTEVLLRARADRPVKVAFLDLQRENGTRQTLAARKVPDDPQAFEVKLTLYQRGTYRLRFTTETDEAFVDNVAPLVLPLPDLPPTVELTEPAAEEVSLPADGLLRVTGKVHDDIGVAGVTLRLRTSKGVMLPDRPVRPSKLALASGGHVSAVDFLDSVDLARLRADAGVGVVPADALLEGWLEARDACDFKSPGDDRVPHVVESRHFRVRLLPPTPAAAAQREKEKRQARDEQKRHDSKQEEQRHREEQARQDQAQQSGAGKEDGTNEPRPGDQGQGDPDKKDADTANQAQKLNDELAKGKQEQGDGQEQPSEGKGDTQAGQSKGGPDGQQGTPSDGQQGTPSDGQHGNAKGEGGGDGQQPGAGKGPGQEGGGASAGAGKEEGGTPGKNEPGQGKGNESGQPDAQGGQSKPDASGPPDPGTAKGGAQDGAAQAGTSKPAPAEGTPESAEGKTAGDQGNSSAGQAKGPDEAGSRGTGKSAEGAAPGAQAAGKPSAGATAARAEAKPASGTDSGDETAQSKPERPQADVRVEDVNRLAQDLQSPDPRKQVDAAHDLLQAAANARDPEAREEARDALAKEGLLPPDGRPCRGKGLAPGGSGPGEQGEGEGQAKGGDSAAPGSQGGSEGKGGGAQGQGEAKDGGGAGGKGGSERGLAKAGTVAPAAQANAPQQRPRSPQQARAQRATVLQLLSAREKLTREQLLQAGFKDDAAYRRFLADCEALLRRPRPPRVSGQENLPAAQQGGNLPSLSGTTVGGTGNDLRTSDQGQPPSGYRKAYDELNRKLRELP